MLKPFSLIFFILVMIWLGSIFVSSEPQVRMDRTCVPVEYIDKMASSGMQLVDQSWGAATHTFFQNAHYGCRFIVWRVFYEDDWKQAHQELPPQTANPPASAPPVTPAASVPAQGRTTATNGSVN